MDTHIGFVELIGNIGAIHPQYLFKIENLSINKV